MTKPLVSKLSGRAGRRIALATTALPMLLLMSPLAFAAAPTAPAAGSLPGNFNATGGTAAYALSNSTTTTSAGISITPTSSTGGVALTFGAGGTPNTKLVTSTGGTTLPSGVTQNSGFSIGSGAAVTIAGAGSTPVLINDESGNPSQVYGSVVDNAANGSFAADTGPLFVANASGVVVGSTGTISAPTGGLGLLGYAQSSSSFVTNGTVTVTPSTSNTGGTPGSGDISVASGATLSTGGTSPTNLGGDVLVAGNGSINIGASPSLASEEIFAGYAPTLTAGSVVANSGVAFNGSSSSVTFSGGSTSSPNTVAALFAAGSVSNSGITDLAANPTIGGAFTNTGVATVDGLTAASINNAGKLTDTSGSLAAIGATGATSGADITNTGIIDETAGTLVLNAAQGFTGASGNFTNTGVIAFTNAGINGMTVHAANIDFGGSIQQMTSAGTSPSALSSTNYLSGFHLDASYSPSGATSPVPGVVDVASTVYSPFSVTGQAVRIMSGGLIDPTGGTDVINIGAGTATDPFFNNAKLAYNLSLFGGTNVASGSSAPYGVLEIITNSTSTSVFPNINLNGVLGSPTTGQIYLGTSASPLGNINGDATGGLSLAANTSTGPGTNTFVEAHFNGNMNNPYGMSQSGQTSYLYNNLPIAVANTAAGSTGTTTLFLDGPSSSSGSAQNVNVMVAGNVTLASNALPTPLPAPGSPISPLSTYTNNHLIVQSTGNIQVGNSGGTFYWPGLVYLSNASSTSNPTTLSTTGSVTFGNTSGAALNNVLPAISTGGTGIFLETNNLDLNGGTVTTSNDSWVNFANASIASAFKLTQASSFYGAYVDNVTSTVTELGVQALPTSAFQPAS